MFISELFHHFRWTPEENDAIQDKPSAAKYAFTDENVINCESLIMPSVV